MLLVGVELEVYIQDGYRLDGEGHPVGPALCGHRKPQMQRQQRLSHAALSEPRGSVAPPDDVIGQPFTRAGLLPAAERKRLNAVLQVVSPVVTHSRIT